MLNPIKPSKVGVVKEAYSKVSIKPTHMVKEIKEMGLVPSLETRHRTTRLL